MTYTDRARILAAAHKCDMTGRGQDDLLIAIIEELIATAVREAMEERDANT